MIRGGTFLTQTSASMEAMQALGIFQVYDPFGIGVTPVGHWDASKITGLNDGDPVSTWTAEWGGYNLTQATSTKRPVYKPTGFNSLPTVRFDGTDDQLDTSSGWAGALTLTANPPMTVFYVYQKRTVTKGSVFNWGTNGLRQFFGFYDDNAVPQYAYDSAAYNVNARSNLTPYVASYKKNVGAINTTSLSRLNGTADNTAGPHDSGLPNIQNTELRIGTWATAYGNVDISEFIVFNSALTLTAVAGIEAQLKAKWGI